MVPQVYNDQACVICNEAITNPVCMHCLEEEMTSWIADFDSSLVKDVRNTDIFPRDNVIDVNCILCGRKMDVCPHCYSKDVYMGLRNKNKILADTFVENFNFELK